MPGMISQEEDDQLLKISSQNYTRFTSPTPIDIEQGIIRVDKPQVESIVEQCRYVCIILTRGAHNRDMSA